MPQTVSIALCTFNGELFLQEQLDSLAAQTRLPDEVVVGDDGSTDETLKILEAWAKTVPFSVRIQKNKTSLKPAKNFEATMLRCSMDVIFLCDQDDVWLPEKLEKMMTVFETKPEVGLVYCDADVIDSDGTPLGFRRSKISFADVINGHLALWTPHFRKHPNPAGCCAAIRSRILPQITPFADSWGHDVFIYTRAPAFTEVVTLSESLFHYRLHGQNVTFPGNWKERYQKHHKMEITHYKWCAGIYFFLENDLRSFLQWVERAPETPSKHRMVRFLRGNQTHYPNRSRIQRNLLVFFPLLCLEVLSGRYFERFQPWQSILYDIRVGFLHSFMPHRLIADFYRKWSAHHD